MADLDLETFAGRPVRWLSLLVGIIASVSDIIGSESVLASPLPVVAGFRNQDCLTQTLGRAGLRVRGSSLLPVASFCGLSLRLGLSDYLTLTFFKSRFLGHWPGKPESRTDRFRQRVAEAGLATGIC